METFFDKVVAKTQEVKGNERRKKIEEIQTDIMTVIEKAALLGNSYAVINIDWDLGPLHPLNQQEYVDNLNNICKKFMDEGFYIKHYWKAADDAVLDISWERKNNQKHVWFQT